MATIPRTADANRLWRRSNQHLSRQPTASAASWAINGTCPAPAKTSRDLGDDRGNPGEVREAVFALPFGRPGTEPIGNDADIASDDAARVGASAELRVESLNGTGLLNVERLAGSRRTCRVDQPDVAGLIHRARAARDGAADLPAPMTAAVVTRQCLSR